nr:MAG TPA: hypothetical protein [Caudoviricetes sp.]
MAVVPKINQVARLVMNLCQVEHLVLVAVHLVDLDIQKMK